MYIRKTKDVYYIIWNGEIIDETDSFREAQYMRREYSIAFRGYVKISKKRVKITEDKTK